MRSKKQVLFSRIVFTVFVTMSVAVALASLGYYFPAKAAILRQRQEAAQRNLIQISYTEKLVADLARAGAAQVFSDSAMARLLFFTETDVHSLSSGLSRLDLFRWNNPHIHSIYLYNARTGLVYVSADDADHAVQTLDGLFDREIRDLLQNRSPEDLDLNLFPRTVRVQVARKRSTVRHPVLTMLYFGNRSPQPASRFSTVVINMSETWIRETLRALNNDANYTVDVLVPPIGFSGANYVPLNTEEPLPPEVYDAVSSMDAEHAQAILSLDDRREILTVHNPDFSRWRFFSRSDYHVVMAPLRSFGRISAVVAIGSLVVAVAAAFVGSSRIYKPVHQISEDLRSLEELHHQEREQLRNETFHNLLLESDRWSDDVFLQTIIDFDVLPPDESPVCPVCIRHGAEPAQRFHVEEKLKERFFVRSLTTASDQTLLLVAAHRFEPTLTGAFRGLLSSTPSLFAAIGPIAQSLNDLPAALRTTLELEKYYYTIGTGHVVDFSCVETSEPPAPETLEKIEQTLAGAVLDGDRNLVDSSVAELRESLQGVTPDRARLAVLNVVHNLQETVQTLRTYYHQDFRNRYYQTRSAVQNAGTIWQAEAELAAFLRPLADTVDRESSNRHKVIAEKVTDYIHEHYGDPNLYVQSIADTLLLSAPYLGRIYHQQSGQSIPDSISRFRVEKACTLLSETDEPIEAVASHVGFSSKTYFHRVFKKLVGTTPNTYRATRRSTPEIPR